MKAMQEFEEALSTKLVSIIVPIYNVDKYLQECLHSIIAQTYTNYEVILVDDGSTDTSGTIADEYADKYDNWKAVHKENAGLNMARATGFEHSNGEWITFIDSDDILHPQFIELLITGSSGQNYMVVCSTEFITTRSDIKLEHISKTTISTESNKELLVKYETIEGFPGIAGHPMTVWSKLYNRSILMDYDFSVSNSKINEDEFMTPRMIMRTNRISFVSAALYFYRINSDITLSKQIKNNLHNGNIIPFIGFPDYLYNDNKKLFEKYKLDVEKYLLLRYYIQLIDRYNRIKNAGLLSRSNKAIATKEAKLLIRKRVAFCEYYNDDIDSSLRKILLDTHLTHVLLNKVKNNLRRSKHLIRHILKMAFNAKGDNQ